MKILYIITKSNYGGAQRYVRDLTVSSQENNEILVAFGGTGTKGAAAGKLSTLLNEAGVRTFFIQNFVRNVFILSDIKAFFELCSIVQKEKPDVLHLNSSKAGALGVFAGRLYGVKKIIFTAHGLPYKETWRPWWGRLIIKYITWLTILLSHKTILVSQSDFESAKTLGFVSHKVVLIHNGIEIGTLTEHATARKKIMELVPNVHIDGFWVGTVAELHQNKNLHIVLEAIALLKKENISASFIAFGEGDERTSLTKYAAELDISDRVHLPGFVVDAATLITAFDIFVLPSKKEGLPYVLLEAGAAGLPVVASNISGNNDIIEHEVSGLLTEQTGPVLAESFTILYKNKGAAKNYGVALKERVSNHFSLSQMSDATYSLYE